MSNTAKISTVVVVIIVLVIIGWLIWGGNSGMEPVPTPTPDQVSTTTQASANTPTQPVYLSTPITDISDGALSTDLSSVQTEIDAFDNDNKMVDQSITNANSATI